MYIRFIICISAIWIINYTNQCHAQEVNYKSYSIYVYNFIKYIEWPQSTKTGGNFSIGIIGDSPVYKELLQLAATKKANGQTIVVKKFATIEEADYCEILYISSSKSSSLKKALEKTSKVPTLVVAEREGLAKKGAGINFVTLEDDVLKFEVNKKVIEDHSLKIPKILLTLGLSVGKEG
ncbi:MAG: YfiR family protein [Bacteroidota bacterium]